LAGLPVELLLDTLNHHTWPPRLPRLTARMDSNQVLTARGTSRAACSRATEGAAVCL